MKPGQECFLINFSDHYKQVYQNQLYKKIFKYGFMGVFEMYTSVG